jgi:hypothetical protein
MSATTFIDYLQARRADCNARFASARRRWPRLDGGDFSLFLRDASAPLAAALEPADAFPVLDAAYDIGLQLVAEKLAGPSAASPAINRLWADVFPAVAKFITPSPRRIISSLCNATHHLTNTPGARPEAWQQRLLEIAPRCSNADEFLTVAQVLAWRAGLPHFRESALAAADALPPALALEALDAPATADWPSVRDSHLADPWFGYHSPLETPRRIGKFRGYGGLFLTPPLVTASAGRILVHSGGEAWILIADAFGTSLHRATPWETQAAAPPAIRAGNSMLPPAHAATSSIAVGKTQAATSRHSHTIWIGPS